MKTIYIIGMGPGEERMMTSQALSALDHSDVIVGYTLYIDLLPEKYKSKELFSTPMRGEEKRCVFCFEEARKGKTVSIICSGDAGVYGMASLMYELSKEYSGIELIVIPGITAALSGAAVLGAPINNDFAVISLSDLLTPWEKIEKRLIAAAKGDFAIVIYNPSSKKRAENLRKACDILLEFIEPDRPCGYAENIGRENMKFGTCTLARLRDYRANMFTTLFIGNSTAQIINGRLVTKRGYPLEEKKSAL